MKLKKFAVGLLAAVVAFTSVPEVPAWAGVPESIPGLSISGSVEATSWSEFKTHFQNPNVTKIIINGNITADDTTGIAETDVISGDSDTNYKLIRSTPLEIDLNGHTLNLGSNKIKFVRGSISDKRTYKFTGTGTVKGSGNWTVQVQGATSNPDDSGSAELWTDPGVTIENTATSGFATPLDAFFDSTESVSAHVDFSKVYGALKKGTTAIDNKTVYWRIQLQNGAAGAKIKRVYSNNSMLLGSENVTAILPPYFEQVLCGGSENPNQDPSESSVGYLERDGFDTQNKYWIFTMARKKVNKADNVSSLLQLQCALANEIEHITYDGSVNIVSETTVKIPKGCNLTVEGISIDTGGTLVNNGILSLKNEGGESKLVVNGQYNDLRGKSL